MITVFNSKDKTEFKKNIDVEIVTKQDINKTWIHLCKPSEEEIEKIHQLTDINKELLLKSLDEEETAHIEKEDNTTLLVIDTIYQENNEQSLKYSTIPFSILLNDKYVVTTTLKEGLFIDNVVARYSNLLLTNQKITLILKLLFYNAKHYVQVLKNIEGVTKKIEEQLNKTMKNEGLMELLNLSTSLVYLSTSIGANLATIAKLDKMAQFKEFSEDQELLEDTLIETLQAKETCSIYREILNTKMDAYGNIINNNVNNVMKLLAIVTIVVTIPTLIASIYGMNVTNLPLAENDYGFLIIAGVSLLLSIICAILLFKYTKNN